MIIIYKRVKQIGMVATCGLTMGSSSTEVRICIDDAFESIARCFGIANFLAWNAQPT